jgi:hypothetical protein
VKNQAPTPLAKGKSRTKNFSFEEKDLTPIIAETEKENLEISLKNLVEEKTNSNETRFINIEDF